MKVATVSAMAGVLSTRRRGPVSERVPGGRIGSGAAVRLLTPTAATAGSVRVGQRHRGRDVGEVGERLGEVPLELAPVGVVLLAEQTDVVGGRGGAVEDLAGLVAPTLPGEALDQPERAGEEGALLRVVLVTGALPPYEALALERRADGVDGGEHGRI